MGENEKNRNYSLLTLGQEDRKGKTGGTDGMAESK